MRNALAFLLSLAVVASATLPSNAQQRRQASDRNADAVWAPGTHNFQGAAVASSSPTGLPGLPIVVAPDTPQQPTATPTQPETPQPMTQICWFEGGGTHCYGPYVWSTNDMQSNAQVRYFNDYSQAAAAYQAQGNQIPSVAP